MIDRFKTVHLTKPFDTDFAKGSIDNAIADYSQAIHFNPQNPDAYYVRGAARDFQAALEACPDYKQVRDQGGQDKIERLA